MSWPTFSGNTAQLTGEAASFRRGNCASCARSKYAAPPRSGDMPKNAASAITRVSPTTPAATAIVRNAKTRSGQNGWKAGREGELLPVEYFHVVFTIPDELARIAFHNKEVVYGILFRAAAETLLTIARDPKHLGAEIGFFGVLHTWGQNLPHHPHVHFVVPGGGLTADHQWVSCRSGFFLSVRVLSRLFRRLFLEALRKAFRNGKLQFFGETEALKDKAAFARYLAPVEKAEWVVYAKHPFGGPRQVLGYPGRYTHRVAISNNRILDVGNGKVRFQWKDYRGKGKQKSRVMTLDADEFIRRFLIHTLPPGFQRIRYFGFLTNRFRKEKLAVCRGLLANPVAELLPVAVQCDQAAPEGRPLRRCPQCKTGILIRIAVFPDYRWPERPPDSS